MNKNLSKPECSICLVLFFYLAFSAFAFGQSAVPKKLVPVETKILNILESKYTVNIYEKIKNKKKSPITFVVLHHNEDVGLGLVKEIIQDKGGRLVEMVSERGNKSQRILFINYKDKILCIDPNRIFSDKGIDNALEYDYTGFSSDCQNTKDEIAKSYAASPEVKAAIKQFQTDLLKIILPEKKCSPNETAKIQLCKDEVLAAVHNNKNYKDDKKYDGINAKSFVEGGDEKDVTEAIYIVNKEDVDNFFIVSNNDLFLKLLNYKEKKKQFSIAVQIAMPSSDDGSLSVFCGLKKIAYINIEADIEKCKQRQREMINRVIEKFPSK